MIKNRQNRIKPFARGIFLPLVVALFLGLSGCSVVNTLLDEDGANAGDAEQAEIVVVTDSTPVEESEAPADSQQSDQPAANETPEPEAAEPEDVPENETVSPTTGRPLPENSVYRPVFVVMDNAAQARPQTALMLADIVYEFPLDRADHATRYLALFSDEMPDRVGPVSTSRSYLMDTAREWGGMYVSLGDPEQADEAYPKLAGSGIRYHVENSGDAVDFFYRDKTITAIEEHTNFFKLREYVDTHYNFSVKTADTRFAFEHGVDYEKGKAIVSVGIPFTSSDSERVFFTYDKAKNLLSRQDKNSKNVLGESKTLTPKDDLLGYENVPITVQNLIVQFVRVSSYDSVYRTLSVVGRGDCMYFVNGRAVSGSWSRPSLDEPTSYKLYDGTILRLEPGTTWIMMMPGNRDLKVRYAG